jgi:hypothetical protein
MVIIMEMGSGRASREEIGGYGEAYGDEVLSAGWTDVPPIEARLQEVVVAARREPAKADIEGFMARLHLRQE